MTEQEIIDRVAASPKYRFVGSETIARIVHSAAMRYGLKRAEDEARRLLHQIWGVYYGKPAATLLSVDNLNKLLAVHQSTHERLPILRAFYEQIFAITGRPKVIADYACGLNPLAFATLQPPFPDRYLAFDIDDLTIDLLNQWLAKLGLHGRFNARRSDLLLDPPAAADVAFLFKVLPPLELQQKGVSASVIDKQPAKFVVASYPTRSVSGKEKGMGGFYRQQFYAFAGGKPWKITELTFANELIFVIDKQPAADTTAQDQNTQPHARRG